MNEIPSFVKSQSTRIARYAAAYTAELDRHVDPGRMTLELFATEVEKVLDRYDPVDVRWRSNTLVFRHLYDTARNPRADEEVRPISDAVLAALFAAEVEFRGPFRLSSRQNTVLAEEFEYLGAQLATAGLYTHAALAYRRAMALYRINEDDEAEDRSGLRLARAGTYAAKSRMRRWTGQVSFVLCGHGYRPSRLLGWVVVLMVLFTAIGVAFRGGLDLWQTVYMGATSVLNPVGFGDTVDDAGSMDPAGRVAFVLEAWIGAVALSVFFALLVRKWFRM